MATTRERAGEQQTRKMTLREACCQGCDLQADGEAGILRNVKILGLASKNRRRYLREALQNALPMYEKSPVNLDHPDADKPESQRALRDRFGIIENVRLADDGLRGDLKYNPRHPMADTIAWFAAEQAGSLGCSHNAVGEGKTDADGVFVVERIHRVFSIDLVADPATSKSLYEGTTMQYQADATEAEPDIFAADDMPADDTEKKNLTEEDPDLDVGVDAEGDASHETAIGHLIMAILNDPALDRKTKQKKVLASLKLYDDDGGGAEEEGSGTAAALPDEEVVDADAELEPDLEEADESADDEEYGKKKKPCDESVAWNNPALELEFLRGKEESRKLCEALKLPHRAMTEAFVESLATFGPAKRKELIEDRKSVIAKLADTPRLPRVAGKGKPRSAAPAALRESVNKDISLDDFINEVGL